MLRRFALLLPPARQRPAPRAVLAALAAAIAPALLPAALGMADVLRWSRPEAFALLLLLPWLAWLQLAGWGALRGARALAALALRAALLAALAAALADPRAVRQGDRLGVAFCLDRSDSIGAEAGEQARAWMLRAVAAKPAGDRAGLVVFAREAAVELPVRAGFPLEAFTTRVAGGGTDLERALDLAAGILPEDGPGRIVLASDGVATDGAVERAVERLAARGIAVDVLPVSYDHAREAWLERLELPAEAHPGDACEAAVVLAALSPGRGELVLRDDGREVARGPVAWEAGRRRLRLPITVREPGFHRFAAALEPAPGDDGWRENNLAFASLAVAGGGGVLLLHGPRTRDDDWRPLAAALGAEGRAVRAAAAAACPDDPLALAGTASVWLVDVPADALTLVQQGALRDAVRDLGTGLVMVGGGDAFGPGGWNRTPVEEALPVRMDITARRVLPKGALAVVLHTCEFPDGNTWAKRITRQAMRTLSPQDEVGALDFEWGGHGGGGERWIFPLTPMVEYERLVPRLEQAEPGDMPSFATMLAMAAEALEASDAASRHVIVISDGDPSPPPPELIQRLVAARISVSTVSIFPHGGQEVPAFSAIASATGGRSYFPRDPAHLPQIFTREARTLRRSQVQNRDFVPEVAAPSPILKGIDALPPLHGYVLTTPKAEAQVVLEGPDGGESDPVLAVWRFGTGAAAAFTADLGGNWGRDWLAWERYRAFVDQLASAVAGGGAAGQLRLRVEADGAAGVVTVEDRDPRGGLGEPRARLEGPGGGADLVLAAQAPGRWQGRFPAPLAGRYRVAVAGQGEGRSERAVGGLEIAYPAEYRRFRSEPRTLAAIAARTGGRLLEGSGAEADALFRQPRTPRAATRGVLDLALLAAALLLLADVAVRRVQLGLPAWRAPWRRPAAAPTATMATLLTARRRPVAGPLPPPSGSGLPPAAPPATPPPPPPPARGATAGRLLDAKRRRHRSPEDPP